MNHPYEMWVLFLMLQFYGLHQTVTLPPGDPAQEAPSHVVWDNLLKSHVGAGGLVNYNGFMQDRKTLEKYLESLSEHIPANRWSREARLAYYINLYNAATVLLILDHYPIESIRDISDPWGSKRIQIGDERYSLEQIEHGILRKMDEPRIHFAINCASFSCPELRPWAFSEADLENQLEYTARDFINDPLRNHISEERAKLSRIFKWYKSDFKQNGMSLIDYLNQYLTSPIAEETRKDYLTYDWSLNEVKP